MVLGKLKENPVLLNYSCYNGTQRDRRFGCWLIQLVGIQINNQTKNIKQFFFSFLSYYIKIYKQIREYSGNI